MRYKLQALNQLKSVMVYFQPTVMNQTSSFALEYGGKMFAEPYLETLPDLFVSYVVKILKVGFKIPRIEYYMTKSMYKILFTIYPKHY